MKKVATSKERVNSICDKYILSWAGQYICFVEVYNHATSSLVKS